MSIKPLEQTPIDNKNNNASTQEAITPDLPPEVLFSIFQYALESSKPQESKRNLDNLRLVCKDFKKLIDEKVLKAIWQQVKNIPYIKDPLVQNELPEEIIAKDPLVQNELPEKILNTSDSFPIALRRFKLLSKVLESETFLITPIHYQQQIAELDKALVAIWEKYNFSHSTPHSEMTANSIRDYLRTNSHSILNVAGENFGVKDILDFDLSQCHLSYVPLELALFSSVTKLDLNANSLSHVPFSVFKLANLAQLNLAYNQIKTIPENIDQIFKLTSLKLYANQITSIPCRLKNLKNLKSLELYDNPICTKKYLQFLEEFEQMHNHSPSAISSEVYVEIQESIQQSFQTLISKQQSEIYKRFARIGIAVAVGITTIVCLTIFQSVFNQSDE